jgi:hypothetical protein
MGERSEVIGQPNTHHLLPITPLGLYHSRNRHFEGLNGYFHPQNEQGNTEPVMRTCTYSSRQASGRLNPF